MEAGGDAESFTSHGSSNSVCNPIQPNPSAASDLDCQPPRATGASDNADSAADTLPTVAVNESVVSSPKDGACSVGEMATDGDVACQSSASSADAGAGPGELPERSAPASVECREELNQPTHAADMCSPESDVSRGGGVEASTAHVYGSSSAEQTAEHEGRSTRGVVPACGEAADAGGADSDGKESNESTCNECGGGGEVVCCDFCVKSYHSQCLSVAARPRLRTNADEWYCPECAVVSGLNQKPSAPTATAAHHTAGSRGANGAPELRAACRPQASSASPNPFCSGSTASATAHGTLSGMPPYAPVRRRKAKAADDYETRINVGPNHQVPQLPDFFLARGDGDLLTSLTDQALADGSQSQALGPLLVYSPYLMERSKQQCLAEKAPKACITSQKDLAEFLTKCSRRWKVRPGWQPFSPEFAYKLLHRANYDPERALRMMDDAAFCFQSICDPPLRKYENKWKRRDKRGTFPSSPYPPPVVVRGYLNEKQRQMRLGR